MSSESESNEDVNYKGKTICQKTPPHEIKCKCPVKCFKLITKEVLSDICRTFYSMENKNVQDCYLQTLIEKKEIKRRTKSKVLIQKDFKRQNSFFYKLLVNGKFFTVCKNDFNATHGWCHSRSSS